MRRSRSVDDLRAAARQAPLLPPLAACLPLSALSAKSAGGGATPLAAAALKARQGVLQMRKLGSEKRCVQRVSCSGLVQSLHASGAHNCTTSTQTLVA